MLISLDDATTLFHEFGHALHGLLQDITYPGLATTPRDFVEYPSQVNEHWLLTREVLDRFARHYQTGEPMPQALVDRIKQSEKFNQGYATVEYLAAAILDMDLHTRPDGAVDSGRVRTRRARTHRHAAGDRPAAPAAAVRSPVRQRRVLGRLLQLSLVGRHGRRHVAGVRRRRRPWDKALAGRLRTHILSNGNTIDRAEAYRRFRGRDPDVKALLEKRGFPE